MKIKKSNLIKFGIVISLVLFGVILIGFFTPSKEDSLELDNEQTITGTSDNIITLTAQKFSFDKDIIRVKSGEEITIKVKNLDAEHGILIPDLGVFGYGKDEVTFTPTQPGEYEFFCANPYCGGGHQRMKGTLIVE